MKKYITLAALLTAGAAFANADVTTTFANASNNTDVTKVTLTTTDDVTVAISSLKKSGGATSTDYTTNLGVKYSDTIAGILAPDVNVATAGQWQLVLNYTDLASNFMFTEVKLETIGFNGDGAWQNMGNGAVAEGTTSGTTTPANSSAGKYVGFTVEYSLNNSEWTQVDKTYSIDVSTGDTSNGNETYRSTTFKLDDALALVGEDFYLRISTSQDYTAGTFAGLKSVSLIPEPSAFGLLAGLGALALVGARRRRK